MLPLFHHHGSLISDRSRPAKQRCNIVHRSYDPPSRSLRIITDGYATSSPLLLEPHASLAGPSCNSTFPCTLIVDFVFEYSIDTVALRFPYAPFTIKSYRTPVYRPFIPPVSCVTPRAHRTYTAPPVNAISTIHDAPSIQSFEGISQARSCQY